MARFTRRGLDVAAVAVVLCWSRAAQAQIGEGELMARLSWAVLLPLGLVQTFVAAAVRSHLTRRRSVQTAGIALLSIGAGLLVGVLGENARSIGAMLAIVAFLPGLPVAIDLGRQKAWAMIVVTFLLPASLAALIILEGATPFWSGKIPHVGADIVKGSG